MGRSTSRTATCRLPPTRSRVPTGTAAREYGGAHPRGPPPIWFTSTCRPLERGCADPEPSETQTVCTRGGGPGPILKTQPRRWRRAPAEPKRRFSPAAAVGCTASPAGCNVDARRHRTAALFELYLRADAAAGWSVVVMWRAGDGDGPLRPTLLSLIREARVDGWEGMDGGAVTLPPVSPASPAVPVDEWVGGYPGPTEADAGAGTATVTAVADGSDGRRLVSWTVTDGVRWTPAGINDVGDDPGTRQVVALEDGLYLSVMADPWAGGVLAFGLAMPLRAGQARQRLLVVLEPGAVFNGVVHEKYPPTIGDLAA